MADNASRGKTDDSRPKIWASGGQRPPFDIRALGRAALYLARTGIAPVHAWSARTARRVAVNVMHGAGRIPADKLGRAARFVPSHLRVAAWIKNVAATLAHASATADPDTLRGNALVAEIAPHLWPEASLPAAAPAPAPTPPPAEPEPEPVVLREPEPAPADPLASIRDDLADAPPSAKPRRPALTEAAPNGPPAAPGPIAEGAIQVTGYLIGWGTSFAALPYGVIRALWQWAKGQDLRKIGVDD